MKTDHGIVAAVYRGDHGSCSSKIYSKKHNDLSEQSGGFGASLSFYGLSA
jgi:hypothetical protein